MKPKAWAERIKIWDDHVRRGQISTVQADLSDLTLSRIPRSVAAQVATIAFRSGLPFWSLRLLNPLIRPEKPLVEKATPDEIIAYSGALFRVGSYQEGFELLRPLDADRNPDALLQKSFGHFRQWEYDRGVPLLRKFLSRVSKNEYRHLVGRVNLTAGLIFQARYDEAQELTTELLRETEANGFMLLYGNTLELLAQIRVFQNRHRDAEDILLLAEEKLSASPGQYSFFVKKWTVINRWLENHQDPSAMKGLAELRKSSNQIGHWETARDCDYYEALRTRDTRLVTRLNFGTPFLGFRRRLADEFGAIEQKTLFWSPGVDHDEVRKTQTANRVVLGNLPETLRRCFSALTKDFYRPMSLGELFSEVYPGEFFDPFSSPMRLETTIRRLRRAFEDQDLPLNIQVKNKTYRLVSTGDCVLEVHRQRKTPERNTVSLENLKSGVHQRSFDLAAVQTILGVSVSTAQRLLRSEVAQRRVARMGYGRNRRFKFVK